MLFILISLNHHLESEKITLNIKFDKCMKKSFIFCFIIAVITQSCNSYKNIAYFKDIPDSSKSSVKTAQYNSLHIQPGDMLYVNIMTIDPNANAIFSQSISSVNNLQANSPTTIGGVSLMGGNLPAYMVDQAGVLEMPLLGKFKASSLTTEELGETILKKVSEFYKTSTVTVRFANLKVNVLGEVNKPGTYIFNSEKNSIFDALSIAGDLTVYGKRENLLLIRDSSGFSNLIRFSLNSKDIINKPFFYLKQNDVIYVETSKSKAAALDQDRLQLLTVITSFVTLLIAISYRIK